MRNLILMIMLVATASFAITGYSVPNDFVAGDVVKASKIMENYNSGAAWSTATVDTLEKKFVRFTDTKDTTFDTLKAYTVRATNELRANNRFFCDSLARVDSLHSVRGISATNAWMTGTVFTDSLYSNRGINVATGYFTEVNSTTDVGSVTGTFTGTITTDSLKSTKGISATTGTFSGALSGTAITGTGTAKVDSLASTKGVSGTYGRFSGALSGTTLTASSTATVDSLKSIKGISATDIYGSGNTICDGSVSASSFKTTWQSTTLTTDTVPIALNSGNQLLANALTGNIIVKMSNKVANLNSELIFTQGATAKTVTLFYSGVSFKQTGTTNSGTSTLVISGITTVNAYYRIEMRWVTSTSCYVSVQ